MLERVRETGCHNISAYSSALDSIAITENHILLDSTGIMMGDLAECELDAGVWSKLPAALLESVFARLPTDAIGRTACLSQEWKRALSTCSHFTRLCAEFQPNLCGMVGLNYTTRTCWVRVYDIDARKWLQPFSIDDMMLPWPTSKTDCADYVRIACDGGLICLMRNARRGGGIDPQTRCIFVLNPRTRQRRQLPMNRLVRTCNTVQLKVDRNTGMYRITLTGQLDLNPGGRHATEVYDSDSNEWSQLSSELVLCLHHQNMKRGFAVIYDCSRGQYRTYYPPPSRAQGEIMERYITIHSNDLYVLERTLTAESEDGVPYAQFAVCKYADGNWQFGHHGRSQGLRPPEPDVVYECKVEALGGSRASSLFVSETFVMVVEPSSFERPEEGYIVMLYDMKKGEWHNCRDDRKNTIFSENIENPFGCELRWDARP